MKSCPTCNRTFEDTFTFCLMDGSVLSAPYDPKANEAVPPTHEPSPPRTEVMNAAVEPEPLPPTRAATPQDLRSTIASPPPAIPPVPPAETSSARPEVTKSVIVVIVIIVASAVGIFILATMPSSRKTSANKVDVNIRAPSPVNTGSSSANTSKATATELTIRISHNGHILPGYKKPRPFDVRVEADERNHKDWEIKPGQDYEVTVQDNIRVSYNFFAYDSMELTINGRRAKFPQSDKLYDEVFITTDNYQQFLQ